MKRKHLIFFAIILCLLLASCSFIPPSSLPHVTTPSSTGDETTTTPSAPSTTYDGPVVTVPSTKGVSVMIDAGHGEIDPGALGICEGTKYYEKDINLAVSLILRDELLKRGYEVFMIREDDTSLLHGRDNITEAVARRELGVSLEADLYISIHCNSYAGQARAYGPIIFYNGKANYNSEEFASELASAVTERTTALFPSTRACRTIRDDDYAVLKIKSMPSFIFEMGFLTDEEDILLLKDAEWQRAMAISIADGVDRLCEKKYIKQETTK